jgi:ABC-type proline/glycine betaine transport system permease subunit
VSLKLAPSDYEIYLPIAEWIEKNIKEWLFMQRPLFKKLSAPIDTVLNSLEYLFNIIPFPVAVLIFIYFAYKTNGFKFAVMTLAGLVFIDLVDLW